jgi:hypothetical protein
MQLVQGPGAAQESSSLKPLKQEASAALLKSLLRDYEDMCRAASIDDICRFFELSALRNCAAAPDDVELPLGFPLSECGAAGDSVTNQSPSVTARLEGILNDEVSSNTSSSCPATDRAVSNIHLDKSKIDAVVAQKLKESEDVLRTYSAEQRKVLDAGAAKAALCSERHRKMVALQRLSQVEVERRCDTRLKLMDDETNATRQRIREKEDAAHRAMEATALIKRRILDARRERSKRRVERQRGHLARLELVRQEEQQNRQQRYELRQQVIAAVELQQQREVEERKVLDAAASSEQAVRLRSIQQRMENQQRLVQEKARIRTENAEKHFHKISEAKRIRKELLQLIDLRREYDREELMSLREQEFADTIRRTAKEAEEHDRQLQKRRSDRTQRRKMACDTREQLKWMKEHERERCRQLCEFQKLMMAEDLVAKEQRCETSRRAQQSRAKILRHSRDELNVYRERMSEVLEASVIDRNKRGFVELFKRENTSDSDKLREVNEMYLKLMRAYVPLTGSIGHDSLLSHCSPSQQPERPLSKQL